MSRSTSSKECGQQGDGRAWNHPDSLLSTLLSAGGSDDGWRDVRIIPRYGHSSHPEAILVQSPAALGWEDGPASVYLNLRLDSRFYWLCPLFCQPVRRQRVAEREPSGPDTGLYEMALREADTLWTELFVPNLETNADEVDCLEAHQWLIERNTDWIEWLGFVPVREGCVLPALSTPTEWLARLLRSLYPELTPVRPQERPHPYRLRLKGNRLVQEPNPSYSIRVRDDRRAGKERDLAICIAETFFTKVFQHLASIEMLEGVAHPDDWSFDPVGMHPAAYRLLGQQISGEKGTKIQLNLRISGDPRQDEEISRRNLHSLLTEAGHRVGRAGADDIRSGVYAVVDLQGAQNLPNQLTDTEPLGDPFLLETAEAQPIYEQNRLTGGMTLEQVLLRLMQDWKDHGFLGLTPEDWRLFSDPPEQAYLWILLLKRRDLVDWGSLFEHAVHCLVSEHATIFVQHYRNIETPLGQLLAQPGLSVVLNGETRLHAPQIIVHLPHDRSSEESAETAVGKLDVLRRLFLPAHLPMHCRWKVDRAVLDQSAWLASPEGDTKPEWPEWSSYLASEGEALTHTAG